MTRRFGIIDIGSVKAKCLIFEYDDQGLRQVFSDKILTVLGRVNPKAKVVQPERLGETISAVQKFQVEFLRRGVERIRTVSTHALREMDAGPQIAAEIERRTGLAVEIISQEEEGQLFFRAVMRDFATDEDFAVADVGGGSVQLLVGNRAHLKQSFLLKTGTMYLHDNFTARRSGDGYPTADEVERMKQYILEQLAPIQRGLGTPLIYGSTNIIDLFRAIGLPLKQFGKSPSHPIVAEPADLGRFLDSIIHVPYEEREARFRFSERYYMYGIDKAFLNILALAGRLGAPQVIPSNANIGQGLALSMVANDRR